MTRRNIDRLSNIELLVSLRRRSHKCTPKSLHTSILPTGNMDLVTSLSLLSTIISVKTRFRQLAGPSAAKPVPDAQVWSRT